MVTTVMCYETPEIAKLSCNKKKNNDIKKELDWEELTVKLPFGAMI